jgi:hypothetical protein
VALNGANEFGTTPFNGDARWLDITVRCPAGSGTYTPLAPRQTLAATPYALSLRAGAVISGTASPSLRVLNTDPSGIGMYGSGNSIGVGDITFDFGFQVTDRFFSIVPEYNQNTAVIATVYSFPTANQVRFHTYTTSGAFIDSAVIVIVY